MQKPTEKPLKVFTVPCLATMHGRYTIKQCSCIIALFSGLPYSLFFSFDCLISSRRSLWARAQVPLLLQSGFLSPATTLSSVPSIVVPLMGSTQRQMESSSALVDFFPLLRPLRGDRGPGVSLVVLLGFGRHCNRLNLPFRSHSILESF